MGYDRTKIPRPLYNLSGDICGQIECLGCIIEGKVYKAVPPAKVNDCTGCVFNQGGGLTKHCAKLKCSPVYRDDKRDVIWVEHTDHYTGEED